MTILNPTQWISLADKAITVAGTLAIAVGVGDQATIGPLVTDAVTAVGTLGLLYAGIRSIVANTHQANVAKGNASKVALIVSGGTSP